MLRYRADVRTILVLAGMIALSVVQWHLGRIYAPLYAVGLWLSLTAAIISHSGTIASSKLTILKEAVCFLWV